MGAIFFSIDSGLLAALKTGLALEVFVETGTYQGDSLQVASPYFSKKLFSCELSQELFEQTKERFKDDSRAHLACQSSPEFIASIRSEWERMSTVFWLDAHWCVGTATAGEQSQCPLLGELEAIGSLNEKSVVLIDDARLFMSPPPEPHEISQWPRFSEIVLALQSLSGSHSMSIFNDTIAFYPNSVVPIVEEYVRSHSVDWLKTATQARKYHELRQSSRLSLSMLEKKVACVRRFKPTVHWPEFSSV